jgi:peptidoglycan/LPS O-acetylase OafA/YrhL
MQDRGRIPELDGLRGIAIGLILFYHYLYLIAQIRLASTLSYLFVPGRFGWSGVDLFFVLSGFLIGGILLDAREASNLYRVFYVRRFFRIIPAYSVLLICYLFLSFLVPLNRSLGLVVENRLPIFPYFFFLQNFWMGAHNTLGGNALGITWSLAIEEQFYLTLPMLIRLVPPRRLVTFLLTGIGLAEVIRLLLCVLLPANGTFYAVLMPCRADALLLGVLGAYAVREPSWLRWLERNRHRIWLPIAILATGIGVMAKLIPRTGFVLMAAGGYTLIALFFLCVLLYGLLIPESWLSRCLRWKWLRSLGIIAYGTYLFHDLVLGTFFALFRSSPPRIASLGDLLLTISALVVTILACSLSWRFFEKPLVRLGHRWGYIFEPSKAEELAPISAKKTELADAC